MPECLKMKYLHRFYRVPDDFTIVREFFLLTEQCRCAITVLTQLIHIEQIVHKHMTKLCESVRRKTKLFGDRNCEGTEQLPGTERRRKEERLYDSAELP